MEEQGLCNQDKPIHFNFDNALDNKNKTVYAMMSWIVENGWFSHATMNFLLAGHSHEDIDQYFSVPSMILRHTIAATQPELNAVIAGSFVGKNAVNAPTLMAHITGVHDVTAHWGPHIDPVFGGTKSRCPDDVVHVLKFECPALGEPAQMHYMLLSTDGVWRPTEEGCVQTAANGILMCPNGHPTSPPAPRPLIQFDVSKLMSSIRGALSKKLWLGREAEHLAWWEQWASAFPTEPIVEWTWPAVSSTGVGSVKAAAVATVKKKRQPKEIEDPVTYGKFTAAAQNSRRKNSVL